MHESCLDKGAGINYPWELLMTLELPTELGQAIDLGGYLLPSPEYKDTGRTENQRKVQRRSHHIIDNGFSKRIKCQVMGLHFI